MILKNIDPIGATRTIEVCNPPIVVESGKTADVPDDIAVGLLEQSDIWAAPKAASKTKEA